MTTLSAIKGKDFIVVGSDSQVTSGSLRLPFAYPKIIQEGSNLIGGTGSVGNLQKILNIALRSVRFNKVANDNPNLDIGVEELARELSDLNFQLPLEHKHYNPFSFLVAGIGSEDLLLMSIGDDGSVIKIPTYYSDGSGSPYAMGILSKGYSENLKMNDAVLLVLESLKASSDLDVYTNSEPQVFCLEIKDGAWQVREANLEMQEPDSKTVEELKPTEPDR